MTQGWYSDVAERIASANYTFFHAGSLRRTANFLEDLNEDLVGRGFTPLLIDCEDILRDGLRPSLVPEDGGPADLYVIWRPEVLMRRSDFEDQIRRARPAVHSALLKGYRVVIVSTMPQMMFPVPVGSSVIADAAKIHPRPVSAERLHEIVPTLSYDTAERIIARARGCVALAEGYVRIDRSSGSGNRKARDAEELLLAKLRNAFAEIGPELLALLEHLVLECRIVDVPQMDMREHWMSALEDAGLATIDDATDVVRLFDPFWRDAARLALSQALRDVLQAPNVWRAVATSMFELERTVRFVVAQALEHQHGGDWRVKGLESVAAKALALARAETQTNYATIADLHSPLDWLLLDQLLELAAETSRHVVVGGLSDREWRQLSDRVVPIRNRMSHMRLPRPGDLDELRRTLRILLHRMDTVTAPSPVTQRRRASVPTQASGLVNR
ncbi:hypothetical protein ACTMS0_13080 [Micromonospora sp. H33]|uniref:hypothetical protein n=1 Tax=Micromonospora sp. H33 TaxID=3452215 RepID=UPI003F88F126